MAAGGKAAVRGDVCRDEPDCWRSLARVCESFVRRLFNRPPRLGMEKNVWRLREDQDETIERIGQTCFFSWVGRAGVFGCLEIRRRGSVGRFLAREETDVRRCQDERMNRKRMKRKRLQKG